MKRISSEQIKKTDDGFSFVIERPYKAAFGFGEKFDSVNQKGKFVRACVREKCFYQGEFTYCSMPFLLTPNGFGIYVATYLEVDFDLREEGKITVTFPVGSKGEQAEVYLLEGSPKEITSQFRSLAGMPKLFPKWVLGAWMSANRWHTQDEVEEQMRITKELNFPHSVLVIEPWSDCTTHFLWRGSRCPDLQGDEKTEFSQMDFSASEHWRDPKAMIADMHADGLKCLLWIVPIYAQGVNLETPDNHDQILRINEYVKKHKECVLNADGTPYEIPHTWCIESMVPDFTNPVAKAHWFDHFAYLKEMGIDGFKTDGGEFIHDKTVTFYDGTTGAEGQNAYCEQYAEAFAEFVGEEGIVFARAGGQRSPTFSVIWAGDQESTWSEFRSVIKAGLSAGLSGVNCWGFDIAGFSGYLPSAELYLRAVQAAAFVPVMQWHSDPVGNGRCDFTGAWQINDRSPWNMAAYHKDESLLKILREQFYLHYNLLPYQYNLQQEAASTGVSPMRHLVSEFPDDERVYDIDDEFMLGDALLIAPVLEDYVDTRKCYLPRGRWFDLFTGEAFEGGEHEIRLKRESIPVFMRDNACVPFNLSGGKLCSDVGNGLNEYRELTFLISGSGKYELKDDFGNEIEIAWNEKEVTVLKNTRNTPFTAVRMTKHLWDSRGVSAK